MTDLAKIAYEAYAKSVDWRTFSGEPMPQWDSVDPQIRNAWDAAAQAVAREVNP